MLSDEIDSLGLFTAGSKLLQAIMFLWHPWTQRVRKITLLVITHSTAPI